MAFDYLPKESCERIAGEIQVAVNAAMVGQIDGEPNYTVEEIAVAVDKALDHAIDRLTTWPEDFLISGHGLTMGDAFRKALRGF